MDTGKVKRPDFVRHLYKVSHQVQSYSVYDISEVTNSKPPILTETLRIEQYRGKSNATDITEYLRLRTTTNWSTSEQVTGLRPTYNKNVFYGNRIKDGKKSLLVFIFQKDRELLYIDVYRSFYPTHNGILKDILKHYKNA